MQTGCIPINGINSKHTLQNYFLFFLFHFTCFWILTYHLTKCQIGWGGGSLCIQILCRILFTKPQFLIKKNQSKTSQDGYTLVGGKKYLKIVYLLLVSMFQVVLGYQRSVPWIKLKKMCQPLASNELGPRENIVWHLVKSVLDQSSYFLSGINENKGKKRKKNLNFSVESTVWRRTGLDLYESELGETISNVTTTVPQTWRVWRCTGANPKQVGWK